MVAGERHLHDRTRDDLALVDDCTLLDRPDREDGRLRRVEHGYEAVDAVHAEVGDRERAVLEVGRLELAAAGALDDVGAGAGEIGDRAPLAAWDYGHDEPLRDRDR